MGEKGNALDAAGSATTGAATAAAGSDSGLGSTVVEGATSAVAKTGDELRAAIAGAGTEEALEAARERLRRTQEPPGDAPAQS